MMTERRPETPQEPRSAFGEVLAELMAQRGRKTDDDAIIQLGEEAFGVHAPDAQANIKALLAEAREYDARRESMDLSPLLPVLALDEDEKLCLAYAYGDSGQRR